MLRQADCKLQVLQNNPIADLRPLVPLPPASRHSFCLQSDDTFVRLQPASKIACF